MTETVRAEAARELISTNLLEVLRERIKTSGGFYSQEAIWLDRESGTRARRYDQVEVFVGPLSPTYEPERLQFLTDILTLGIEKSRVSRSGKGPLGMSLARVQFVEDLEDKTQVITLAMLPQARYARICADYRQAWFDKVQQHIPDIAELTMHVGHDFIARFKDKEHELENWASRLLKRRDENSYSES